MDGASGLRDARRHATDRVPIAGPDEPVASVRGRLIGGRFDCAAEVAIVTADTAARAARAKSMPMPRPAPVISQVLVSVEVMPDTEAPIREK